MSSETVNADIFEDYEGPSIVDKFLYYLFFSIPRIELVGLHDEESVVTNRIIKKGLWNRIDRIKLFFVITGYGLLIWIGALILLYYISDIGIVSDIWVVYSWSGILLIVSFAFSEALVTHLPTIPWLPGEGVERFDLLGLFIYYVLVLIILTRVAVGSLLIILPIIGVSAMFDFVMAGAAISHMILLFITVCISGWYLPISAAFVNIDDLDGWKQAFIRYEELANRVSSLNPTMEQDYSFELDQYNPKHADSLEEAQECLERFELHLDSYDQLLESYSQAEDLTDSDPDSELSTLADAYVRPYNSPEEAAEKADELNQIVEQFPIYQDQYQDLNSLVATAGFTDQFESVFPTPEELLQEAENAQFNEAFQRLNEWRWIYAKYISLSDKLRDGMTPNSDKMTEIKGIGDSRRQALAEVGIETPRDLQKADLQDIASAEGINQRLASELKSRIQDSIYSVRLEDLNGIGPQTAATLRKNNINSVGEIARASVDDLQSIEGIGHKKATEIHHAAKTIVGTPLPEAVDGTSLRDRHRTKLLDRYSPATTDIDDAKSQIGQLEAWVTAYERYFELRYRAYTSIKKDNAIAAQMESLDFDKAAPWNFVHLGPAREALDTIEQAVVCIEHYQQLLDEVETHSDNKTVEKESDFLYQIENYLRGSSFEWVSNPEAVAETFNLIERILNLGDKIASAQEEYPAYPFEELLDALASEVEEELESVETIKKINNIVDMCILILDYLDTVETDHPSIEAEHWQTAVRTALREQYSDQLVPIERQIERLKNSHWEREDVDALDWEEFESIVAVLFEARGFDTETTRGSVDLGVDVWAKSKDERVAIQAKHYAAGNTVGRETLQKLTSSLAKGDADRAVVVTSSSFADTAIRYADDFGKGLELIDGDELLRELSELEIPPPT